LTIPGADLQAQRPLVRTTAIHQSSVVPRVESLPAVPPIPAGAPLPQPSPPGMSLADFENLALANNPSLAESIARLNALRGKWEQVGLPPNPYAGYSDQQVGSPSVEQRGVIFGQEIVRGNKLELNRAVACQEVQRAQQEYHAQQLRVLTDVRMAFFTALAAQQRNRLAKEIADSTTNSVKITQQRLNAKEVGKADLLQAKIEYETAQILERRTQFQALEAWRKLAAVIGVQGLQSQPLVGQLTGQIPDYEWEPTLARLLSASPEIAAAQAEIQRTRWAYQRAQAEKTSNLSFQGIVQDDRSVDATNGAIQLTMPIPIWNRNQGGITQAGHEALAAARALEKLELDLQQRLATVFQRYQTARTQAEHYTRSILPNTRENLELVRQAYAAGEYDTLQMLVAQRTFAQTELAYVEALQEMHLAALEIEGLLLSNSLQASK
jgi:outer membrane protein, heavy metal efflux system